jgi:hypothetical protein
LESVGKLSFKQILNTAEEHLDEVPFPEGYSDVYTALVALASSTPPDLEAITRLAKADQSKTLHGTWRMWNVAKDSYKQICDVYEADLSGCHDDCTSQMSQIICMFSAVQSLRRKPKDGESRVQLVSSCIANIGDIKIPPALRLALEKELPAPSKPRSVVMAIADSVEPTMGGSSMGYLSGETLTITTPAADPPDNISMPDEVTIDAEEHNSDKIKGSMIVSDVQ